MFDTNKSNDLKKWKGSRLREQALRDVGSYIVLGPYIFLWL